jgi:integron integrase
MPTQTLVVTSRRSGLAPDWHTSPNWLTGTGLSSHNDDGTPDARVTFMAGMREMEASLQEFGEFLLRARLVKEKAAPWCVRWVRRFLSRPASNDPLVEQVRLFCEDLERGSLPDWQVRQAEHALQIYWVNFRKSTDWQRPPATVVAAESSAVDTLQAIEELRRRLRTRHYSYRTEVSYVDWSRRLLSYLAERQDAAHPAVTAEGARDFLTHLALHQHVSASTQNQALSAILLLCREVLGVSVQGLSDAVKARRGRRLPVVLSMPEVAALLAAMRGTTCLMAALIYGGGLRVTEACQLRIKDVDFDQGLVVVRRGKGDKDRSTLLAEIGRDRLREQIRRAEAVHGADRDAGVAGVWLPEALDRKYPNAGRDLAWFWVFPSHTLSTDPRAGVVRRHHISDSVIQKAVKAAEWRGHQADPGVSRPRPGGNHDDLHARREGTPDAGKEPAGSPRQGNTRTAMRLTGATASSITTRTRDTVTGSNRSSFA